VCGSRKAAASINLQTEDDAGKDHPHQGDDRDGFREAPQEPWARNENLIATEDPTCDRDTVGYICRAIGRQFQGFRETTMVKRLQGPIIAKVKMALIAASSAKAKAPNGIENPTISHTAE
jgi:hypothetical protein